MKKIALLGTAAVFGATLLTIAPQPAHAIKCQGPVQINANSRIVTPYCEAEYLAQVARGFGYRTNGQAIRHNINHKAKICEFIGHDSRLASICGGLRRQDRGGGRLSN